MKRVEVVGIRAILHDWDDTVVVTHESIFKLYRNFAVLGNLPAPEPANLRRLWGNPVLKILAGLWPQKDADQLLLEFEASVPSDHAVEPFSWLNETIDRLADHYFLGVISSTPRRSVEQTRAKYDLSLARYVHFQTADDSVHHKPDPRVFDEVMIKLTGREIFERDVVYVGDSLGDLRAAWARGILFVAVTTGFTTRGEFTNAGLKEELILENFGQLPKWLGI